MHLSARYWSFKDRQTKHFKVIPENAECICREKLGVQDQMPYLQERKKIFSWTMKWQ